MKRRFKAGQIYLVDSYCGVRLLARVIRPEEPSGFIGTLVNPDDIKKLNEAGVPSESLNDEIFVFDYHVIRRINKNAKKRRSGNIHSRGKQR